MTFTGLNVTFGWILALQMRAGNPAQIGPSAAPIYGPSCASHNMLAAGISNVAALPGPTIFYLPMASVYAAADSWITVGPVPADPSVDSPVGGRRFIPAITPIDVFCNPGDKIRWAAA